VIGLLWVLSPDSDGILKERAGGGARIGLRGGRHRMQGRCSGGMMARGGPAAGGPVALFCERLRRLQVTSGVRQAALAAAARRSTTQMSDILNGRVRRAPVWEVVEAVVCACLAHAEQAGRLVPPDLGDVEDWRRRYFDLEQDLDARPWPGTEGMAAAMPSPTILAGDSRGRAEMIPVVQPLESWVVDRPGEVDQVVAALLRKGTVAVTTALHGAGGFGKTTVARMVSCDERVLGEFGGRVYWVTVGRDAGPEALAGLVNGLIGWIRPDMAGTFTDARQAAGYLAALLAEGPGRLLILDDVWTEDQLAAFPVAGQCARLVTTRIPILAARANAFVRVDQMSAPQALALLQADLPSLPQAVAEALVQETGRWPLLLRLVNKVLADQVRLDADVTMAGAKLLSKLRQGGKLSMGALTGPGGRRLDVADPAERSKAVRATIEASTGLLSSPDRDRLAELSVFAEDESIPVALITALWQATGGLDELDVRSLCARLADLALLTLAPVADVGSTVTVHDVIRDYHRDQLSAERIVRLHATLLDAVADGLPCAPAASAALASSTVTAWWELPSHARYLRDHLIEHLLAADWVQGAQSLAADLRWTATRLDQGGPAFPYADLALIGTPRAERLQRLLGQAAHMLAPTDPPHSLTDILLSRVSHDPHWGPQAKALAASRSLPALANAWPLPDLPSPALRLTLSGHGLDVRAVAIAPDGSWLVTGSWDGTARIWDSATGERRAVLMGHTGQVSAVAIAPDGTWLATGDQDTARIWDAATGQQRGALSGHAAQVTSVAIAPDGSWLVTASEEGTARTWDAATGELRTTLAGHGGRLRAVAIAPDGTWLASSGDEGTVHTWDTATGELRATFTCHDSWVRAVAIAPDGTWLATASTDGTARTWDAATGEHRATLTGHSSDVRSVAISPDGTWLATVGDDRTARIWDTGSTQPELVPAEEISVGSVAFCLDGTWLVTGGWDRTARIWDTANGRHRDIPTGHNAPVCAVAIGPDGSWFATGSEDGTLRTWDTATGEHRATLTGHDSHVQAVAIAADGTWLATASWDGTARTWDAASGQPRITFADHSRRTTSRRLHAVAISPDGTWLATGGEWGTVRIWDASDGQLRATLTGHQGWVHAVAIAPDGTWLATAGLDESVRIWDASDGQLRATLTGHQDWVNGIAISPSSRWLATASWDRTVRIWDAVNREIAAIIRVESKLSDCAWDPSGRLLAVAGAAGLYLFAFNS
jgi:WD40 repeat protein